MTKAQNAAAYDLDDLDWPVADPPTADTTGRVGALGSLRVLDLSRVLSGPYCTMILGDLGADVVKIETIGTGDDTRRWGPPFVGEESAYFLSVNRNKRSIALDLKSDDGLRIARSLARHADVLVENFRPGTTARLGLGYEELSAFNPSLVYASISGYGQTGPLRDEPGYDAIAQAISGVMSVTGDAGGAPARVGVSSADIGAGMWATVGILAALQARERSGKGQWVDISLLDGQIAWLTYVAGGMFATGDVPDRYGSAHPTIVPYQAFPTADSHVMVAVGNDRLWAVFAEAVGLGDIADDPRFITNADRVTNRDELLPLLAAALSTKRANEWTAILSRAGIPSGPINSVADAVKHPQVVARGMIAKVEHSTVGNMTTIASPIKLSDQPPTIRKAPPTLGEHTKQVLLQMGLSDAAVSRLTDEGAVA